MIKGCAIWTVSVICRHNRTMVALFNYEYVALGHVSTSTLGVYLFFFCCLLCLKLASLHPGMFLFFKLWSKEQIEVMSPNWKKKYGFYIILWSWMSFFFYLPDIRGHVVLIIIQSTRAQCLRGHRWGRKEWTQFFVFPKWVVRRHRNEVRMVNRQLVCISPSLEMKVKETFLLIDISLPNGL